MTGPIEFDHAHQGLFVPIRSLGWRHRAAITKHLLSLGPDDRYLRFGYAATDAQIQRYLASIDFERDDVFGVFNRHLKLIAMAHLALSPDPASESCAEFGVSVLEHARGRGYGGLLFDRAVLRARNEGVKLLFIHALSGNGPMIRIARKAGAELVRDGSETEAHLRLAPANIESRVSDLVQEQFAESDYRLKEQAKAFWSFLATIQEARQGVREARGRAGQ
jgi:GNAT superfamily N-acetyltransferase